MKRILCLGLLLVCLVSVRSEGGDKTKQPFDGTWMIRSILYDGEPFADKELADLKLVIVGNTFKTYKGDKIINQGSFVADVTKKPHTLDVSGEAKGKKYKTLAIFKVEKDTVTVCTAPADAKQRPKEFSSKKGSKNELSVYQRK